MVFCNCFAYLKTRSQTVLGEHIPWCPIAASSATIHFEFQFQPAQDSHSKASNFAPESNRPSAIRSAGRAVAAYQNRDPERSRTSGSIAACPACYTSFNGFGTNVISLASTASSSASSFSLEKKGNVETLLGRSGSSIVASSQNDLFLFVKFSSQSYERNQPIERVIAEQVDTHTTDRDVQRKQVVPLLSLRQRFDQISDILNGILRKTLRSSLTLLSSFSA